ncbi:hypothetical protein BUALT_Bualt01G0190500 [Buddleja alternifolia]|uniref:Uncharacterized protein n=1 Tax=Buddleja alternifolia TaxID=168488 RepID=A0AAV6Y9C4_9LAMI|nr:hypothetical protein BUALT_Bualt01G0190500 [Buddleja alternifolia]
MISLFQRRRRSKGCDEETKVLLCGVAERTRSKRSRSHNLEATTARHGSGAISACRKRRIAVRRSQDSPSSSKDVDKTVSRGESIPRHRGRPKKRRRSWLKSTPRVFGRSNSFGSLLKNSIYKRKWVLWRSQRRSQAKKYDEAAKVLLCDVAERARSKRSSSQNLEATNGSVGISAHRNRRINVERSWDGPSSSKNVNKTVFRGKPTPHHRGQPNKRRRSRLKSTPRVFGLSNNFGNNNEYLELEDIEIERIDEAEFRNQKTHSLSKKGPSTGQELNQLHTSIISRKNVDSLRKEISFLNLHRSVSIEGASFDSDHGWLNKSSSFVQKGIDNEDLDGEEVMIERIDEAEFRNKSRSISKIGPSKRQELDEANRAATSRKNVDSLRKKMFSADLCGSFSSEDAGIGSDQGWPAKSSSFVQKGNNYGDIEVEDNEIESIAGTDIEIESIDGTDIEIESIDGTDIEIEIIDESEFRNKKAHSESQIGPSSKRELNEVQSGAVSGENVDSLRKMISSVDINESFSRGDSDSDQGRWHKSSSFLQEGNNNEDVQDEDNEIESIDGTDMEIERIDETEFRSKKRHSESLIGPSSKQELHEVQSGAAPGKNLDSLRKKISSVELHESFLPNDACGDSDQGQLHKSSSFVQEGDDNEDMDVKEIMIERIEEVGFRNKSCSLSKIGPSKSQELDEGYLAPTSRRTVNSLSKKISCVNLCGSLSSDDAGLGPNEGQPDKSSSFVQKGNSEEDIDPKKVEKIDEAEFWNKRTHFVAKIESSNSSSHSSGNVCVSDSINAFQGDDEIGSYGAEHDINLGIASRTRSKTRIMKQAPKVDYVLSDSSSDSDSSSIDTVFGSVDGEDFGVERYYNSYTMRSLGSYAEEYDVENSKSVEVSAEKSEYCSKQKGSAPKCASKKRCFSNHQNEEKDCNQPASRRLKVYLRKKRLSSNASSKQIKGRKACKKNEVPEEDGEINKIVGDDYNPEECFKERSDGKSKNWPKITYSKQSNTQKDCSLKDHARTGRRRRKKAVSSSHSKDNDYHSDDDIQRIFHSTSSDFQGNTETEKITVADEIEKQTKRKQVTSKHYDFCRMLADSVLERGPVLETKESDEQAKQVLASHTRNTLPLKFRFEDEVPKEVEKTDNEKEMEGLFAELDFNWALAELGSLNYPEVDQENENDPADETQHARCARGKHELELQDDVGLRCIYCCYVALEPRDILPQWAENTYRQSERKRYSETEQLPEFGDLHLQSSVDNIADFRNNANGTVWNIKPGIRESMYQHQQEGFEFLWKNLAGSINLHELKSSDLGGVGGCIISHAPGTGKTRLTIVFIETYLRLFPNCRPVIIAPASMLLTWEEEFRKWNVDFPFYNLNNLEFTGKENKNTLKLLTGSKRRNKDKIRMVKIYSWNTGRSIMGISYSLFEKLTGEKYIKDETGKERERVIIDDKMKTMRKIFLEKPGLVILDEGHTPRNRRSNIWNALFKLHTEKRVILSGTPFQNNFEELFNTLRIVRPAMADVLVRERTFAEMITSRRRKKYKGRNCQSTSISEVTDHAVEKLKISMSPFVHVHKGMILQQSLPGLKDCVVLMKPPPLQKSLIERLEGSPSTFEFEHKVALISVHPYLFRYCDSTKEQRMGIDLRAVKASKFNANEGVKTKFIVELVRFSMAMDEKVLIFSQYIQPLELLKQQLKEIFKWVVGKQILQMRGKLNQKQRQILINIFNDPLNESKVMLASTKCCSEGISLVGASRVVLLDVVWNPSVERQAICRAYRIGQKKFVYTYHLMTSGTTEADKYCRQAEKERLSELVFTSSSNESNKEKHPSAGIEDRILEEMVGHPKLKEMFEKIINQPKDTDLIQTFGLTSS